jgi:ankyrin repeat protein
MIFKGSDVTLASIGWSPLMGAASSCQEAIVLAWLKRGAAVNWKDRNGGSALTLAADHCNGGRIVKVQLKAGTVNTADTFGNAALLTAAESGNELAVRTE